MNIQTFFTLYILSVPVFLFFDFIWLGLIAKNFYQSKIGHLFGEVNWLAAGIFYAIFLLGLTFFAIYPGVQASSWKISALYGALFGFFTYMTYDLTNLATLKGWPLSVAIVDMMWGALLGSLVSAIATGLYFYFN